MQVFFCIKGGFIDFYNIPGEFLDFRLLAEYFPYSFYDLVRLGDCFHNIPCGTKVQGFFNFFRLSLCRKD